MARKKTSERELIMLAGGYLIIAIALSFISNRSLQISGSIGVTGMSMGVTVQLFARRYSRPVFYGITGQRLRRRLVHLILAATALAVISATYTVIVGVLQLNMHPPFEGPQSGALMFFSFCFAVIIWGLEVLRKT